MLYVAIVLALFAMVILSQVIIVVPSNSLYVVERLGAYQQTLGTGRHVLVPFLDRVAYRYTLEPKKQDLSDTCITQDNVTVNVMSSYTWRILDARRFAYNSANGEQLVAELVRSQQRKWIGGRNLDEARENTRELEASVLASAADSAGENGIELVSVHVYTIASSGPR